MKNLLVGNGINCQFDKNSYTSKEIVLRILKNCTRSDFPKEIIVDAPFLLTDHLGQLYLQARTALAGKLDQYAISSEDKESLCAFKEKYTAKAKTLLMTDICFEDYYLLHDLVCRASHIDNTDQVIARESMRTAYLFAIYNDGKLNELYRQYPEHVVRFLNSHDIIFTTNYDSNIENATGRKVNHIHGQFDRLSDVYNVDSLRNKLPDSPMDGFTIDPHYFYLYSNAITTHCGSYKEFLISQTSTANLTIAKMAEAYNINSAIKAEVDTWLHNDNPIVKNLGYAITIKAAHPSECFSEQYDFDSFRKMEGNLDIVGLSPWNDFHIFRAIDNAALSECIYYFFSVDDCKTVSELLSSLSAKGMLHFKHVDEIWENNNAE